MPRKSPSILLFVVVMLALGCVTYEKVPNADWQAIERGERLRITTRAGEVHEADLERVDESTLHAEGIELALADVAFIERRFLKPSPGNVLLLGVGIVAVMFLAAAATAHTLDFE